MSIENQTDSLKAEKIAVIGASRGLGREISKELARRFQGVQLFLASRKTELLLKLADEMQPLCESIDFSSFDLSLPEQQAKLIHALEEFDPDRIFYVAGGGPHGAFTDKQWKDHQWAFEVSLLAPLKILHRFSSTQQLVFVGSDIAENNNSSNELSYGLSKKALRAAIASFLEENPSTDIRLLSPGYMDTELLPPGAPPRTTHHVLSPSEVAQKTIDWISRPKSANPAEWHLVLSTPLISHS